MIFFTVTIPPEQRDKNLTQKLMAENSGIFNWLLQGYALWKKEGLKEPEAIRVANDEYRYDMDSIQAFIDEVMNIDATLKWRLPTKDLYDVYLRWCSKNNERALSQKGLAVRMQEKGFKRGVSNSVRFWLGLGIKPQWLEKKNFYR